MHGLHAGTSRVENSAQGSSCQLKFVHGIIYFKVINGLPHTKVSINIHLASLETKLACFILLSLLLFRTKTSQLFFKFFRSKGLAER